MANDLGFQWYPKDWWTSPTFLKLKPAERYLFLECLFYMYMHGGKLENDREYIASFFRMEITQDLWDTVVKKFELSDGFYTSTSLRQPKTKADISRENGSLGGRPKTQEITQKEPSTKPNEEPKPSSYNRIEDKKNRKEDKRTPERGESLSSSEVTKTPIRSPLPLWAAGIRDGLVLHDVWGKYGKHLEKILPGMKGRERVTTAILNYWPRELDVASIESFKTAMKNADEKHLEAFLGEIAEDLVEVGKNQNGVQGTIANFNDPISYLKIVTDWGK